MIDVDVLKRAIDRSKDENDIGMSTDDDIRRLHQIEHQYCEPDSIEEEKALSEMLLADSADKDFQRILLKGFGHREFLPGQLATIRNVMSGKPTLALLPTGGGKSLCFQFPALVMHGMCLVISPLLSLMNDQLSKLSRHLRGACWNSNCTADEIVRLMDDLRNNRIKVLFVSPEKVLSPGFQHFMTGDRAPTLSFVVIDEVHCVSQWSHNFRPCYLLLAGVLRNTFHVNNILGLTATATQAVVRTVVESIGIRDDSIIDALRPRYNLKLSCSRTAWVDRDAALRELLLSPHFLSLNAIIVYVTFQREADAVAQMLVAARINAASYHAGKTYSSRQNVQKRFMSGRLRVIVATIAFGMGLDRADVSAVIHYSPPRSLENYAQEVGRAGRNGEVALCHTFISEEDAPAYKRLGSDKVLHEEAVMSFLQYLFDGGIGFTCLFEKDLLELSIEPEVAQTIVAYLQLKFHNIRFISKLHGHVSVSFYGTAPDIIRQHVPAIDAVLKLHDIANVSTGGVYKCKVTDIANLSQVHVSVAQQSLLKLKWLNEIGLLWEDDSLCVEVLEIPTDAAKLEMCRAIIEQYDRQESSKYLKLDTAMTALLSVARSSWRDCFAEQCIDVPSPIESVDRSVLEIDSRRLHRLLERYMKCVDEDDFLYDMNEPIETKEHQTSILCC